MTPDQPPFAGWRTTEQVARELGITTGRVRQLARALGLGTVVGRGRLYSPDDVARMRARRTWPDRRRKEIADAMDR